MPSTPASNQSATNRLFLLRHGENPANLSKDFSNRKVDHPLTEKGVLQAQQTADYFVGQGLDAVYSSPLKRARQTATIIAHRLELDVIIIEAFREIDVGSLEGRPATPADWALHARIMNDWFDGKNGVSFPDGEDYNDLWARMQAGLLAAAEDRVDQSILVVGHGGIMTVCLKDLCPALDVDWLRKTHWDNCAFVEITLDQRAGRLAGQLQAWNQHDHLHGAAAELVPGVPE